jgi:hypothetical protein
MSNYSDLSSLSPSRPVSESVAAGLFGKKKAGATKQAFQKSAYKFDTLQRLTASFSNCIEQLQQLLYGRYHDEDGSPSFTLHPMEGPFVVEVDDIDGSMILCNASGVKVL